MSQPPILAAMVPVVEVLDALVIDYYIGGAVASLAHGIYRATADVDIVAEIKPEHVRAFVQSLEDTAVCLCAARNTDGRQGSPQLWGEPDIDRVLVAHGFRRSHAVGWISGCGSL